MEKVQNVADILVDPDGSKEHHDHWEIPGLLELHRRGVANGLQNLHDAF